MRQTCVTLQQASTLSTSFIRSGEERISLAWVSKQASNTAQIVYLLHGRDLSLSLARSALQLLCYIHALAIGRRYDVRNSFACHADDERKSRLHRSQAQECRAF